MITGFGMKTEVVSLRDLMEMIAAGELGLPDFQRSFTWEPKHVRAMLATVLRGWPAGSLMFVAGDPEFAGAARPFEDAPPLSASVRFVVLDGQQRLTALFHALYGRGQKSYYLELPKAGVESLWQDVEQLEEHISWADAGDPPPPTTGDSVQVPFTSLRTPSAYLEWAEGNESSFSRTQLSELYRRMVSQLTAFEFPLVVLPSITDPAAIARMFERVNATGMSLSAFDLVVARTFEGKSESRWNLRDVFDEAMEDNPLLEQFLAEDGLPLLEAIALRTRNNVRRGVVTRLTTQEVKGSWAEATRSAGDVVGYLTSRLGVAQAGWTPYDAFLVVLTAFGMEFELAAHTTLIDAWFWSRAFGSAFEVGVNTTIVREYGALRAAAKGDSALPVLAAPAHGRLTAATRGSEGQLFRAFLCAAAASTPFDLRSVDTGTLTGVLQFGEALAFPIGTPIRSTATPSARVRALSQIVASERPAWLRGATGLANLNDRLPPTATFQFISASAAIADPHLTAEDLWAHRLDGLRNFLGTATAGALDLSGMS